MSKAGTRLRGRLLGRFSLSGDDGSLELRGEKVVALLAYLAAVGEPVERKELVGLLWREGNLGYLRQLLQRVRKLGGLDTNLVATDTHVGLECSTDADEFKAAVRAGDHEAALAHWPVGEGLVPEFLAGLTAPTPELADWLDDKRSSFSAMRERALLAHAGILENQQQLDEAVSAYRELLQIDQLNETAHRGIMRIELLRGDAAAGLAQYDVLIRALRREFNGSVEPVAETRQIAEKLEQQAGTELTGVLQGLPVADRARLMRMSVFEDGFTADAAETVAGADVDKLLAFADSALLSAEDEQRRYRLHPFIRQWGMEQLIDPAAVTDEHAKHYLKSAAALYELVTGQQIGKYLREVTADLDNFRAALTRLYETGAHDDGVELCIYLIPLWDITSRWTEGIDWGTRFLAGATTNYRKGRLHSGVAILCKSISRLDAAHAHFSAALHIFEETGNELGVATEYGNLAMIARARSQFEKAGGYYRHGISLLRAIDDPYALSVLLNNYGVLLTDLRQYDEALDVHRECVAIRRERQDSRGVIYSLQNIADNLHYLGRPGDALAIRQQCLDMTELPETDRGKVLLGMAWDHLKLGQTDKTISLAEPLLADAMAGEDRHAEGYALSYLAAAAFKTGQLPDATRYYKRAVAVLHELGAMAPLAACVAGLALVAGKTGNWDYFRLAHGTASLIWQEIGLAGEPELVAELSDYLSRADGQAPLPLNGLEDLDAALAWLEENEVGLPA